MLRVDREEIAVMGSVLAFQPRDAANIRKPPVSGATASIVIFPGIRYERQGNAPQGGGVKGEAKKGKCPKH